MMDNIREKLVGLLKSDPCPATYLCDRNCKYADLERCFEERFADHLIAHGVTIQEWIPVSEPPKECGRYYTNRKISGGDHVEILQYGIDSDGGYWSCYDDEYGVRLVQNVTHWMPLPQPPKQEV